jgi:hypothetical protein
MYQMGMVMISGGRSRSSFFSDRMGDVFGSNGGVSLGSPRLGQTGAGTYAQLKTDIAVWDSLIARLQRINNQTARNQIANQFGVNDPTNKDKGQYMRDRSAYHIAQAEAAPGGTDYSLFDSATAGPAKNDAKDLESFIGDFRTAVANAENQYGFSSTPQVITNYVSTTPDWVLPVVAGGAALGLLAVLGVFKGIF